jgi:hypothetical protein
VIAAGIRGDGRGTSGAAGFWDWRNRMVYQLPPATTRLGQILRKLNAEPIDHGWYQLTDKQAKQLNNGLLPRPGYEALVAVDGVHFWLSRTRHNGQMVWSVRATKWMLKNGVAVLCDAGSEAYDQLMQEWRRNDRGMVVL